MSKYDTVKYAACGHDLDLYHLTDWKSTPGVDPYLYQYKCSVCGAVEYRIGSKSQPIQGIRVKKTNR
jgi:hypothetical protein